MPTTQNQSHRSCTMQSVGVILCPTHSHATAKRPVMKGNYREPSLSFPDRMKWLANVQQLVAGHSSECRSYPHKIMAVVNVLAHVGNVCRPSLDHIAAKAGCVASTVEACIAWLEEQGALTWTHTARKHPNGRMVRSANLYTLITNFAGFVATVARAMREIWRDRPVSSNPNFQPGLTQIVSSQDQEDARRQLEAVRKARTPALLASWNARHTK